MKSYHYVLVNHDRKHSQTESVVHLQSYSYRKNNALVFWQGGKLYLPISICNWWLLIQRGFLKLCIPCIQLLKELKI